MEKRVISGTPTTTSGAEREHLQLHLSEESGIGFEWSVPMVEIEKRSLMDDLAGFANMNWS